MYTVGELNERVILRRYTETQNEYGTLERTAVNVAKVWALVRPMSGGERDRAQQTEANPNYLVVLRYRRDVTHRDYIVWRGEELNVRFVKDRGPRNQFLELECERAP